MLKLLHKQNLFSTFTSTNKKTMKKILIGGQALIKLGSDRATNDIDYLIEADSKEKFIFDTESNTDYINANGHDLFRKIYDIEKDNEIASPQSLLELKAFAFVQHCQNFNWKKVDATEYDIKFLVRKFDLKELKLANRFMSYGELMEINKIIKSVRK